MSLPIAVAKEFIRIANENGRNLTKLQLQKLLFFAQAWSIVIRDTELIGDDFEAWKLGPVNKAAWQFFNEVDGRVLPFQDNEFSSWISPDDRRFIEAVWNSYCGFGPYELSQMTHAEGPWSAARGPLSVEASGNAVIPLDSISTFYRFAERPKPLKQYEDLLKSEESQADEWLANHNALGA